jgi:hypothetical protein
LQNGRILGLLEEALDGDEAFLSPLGDVPFGESHGLHLQVGI